MYRTRFFATLLIVGCIETWLLQMMTGASAIMTAALALLAVPSVFAGIDLWRAYNDFMDRRYPWVKEANEGREVRRFFVRWIIASLPALFVILVLRFLFPSQFLPPGDSSTALTTAVAILAFHGFLNLPMALRRTSPLSIQTMVKWYRERHYSIDRNHAH